MLSIGDPRGEDQRGECAWAREGRLDNGREEDRAREAPALHGRAARVRGGGGRAVAAARGSARVRHGGPAGERVLPARARTQVQHGSLRDRVGRALFGVPQTAARPAQTRARALTPRAGRLLSFPSRRCCRLPPREPETLLVVCISLVL